MTMLFGLKKDSKGLFLEILTNRHNNNNKNCGELQLEPNYNNEK